jgi:hypothetical protein
LPRTGYFLADSVDTRRSFIYKYTNGLSENLSYAVSAGKGNKP